MNLRGRLAWAVGSGVWFGVAASSGCSSAEAPADGGGVAGASQGRGGVGGGAMSVDADSVDGAADGSSDGSLGGDTEAADAGDIEAGSNCDTCGSPRFTGTCASAEAACTANAGCAAIRNCVFAGGDVDAACALGPTGAACVDACTRTYCTDSGSAVLYRALDECAYCTACAGPCLSYCAAFADSGPATCRDF
jgi:hypothetical protein